MSIDEAKECIKDLVGQELKIYLNKGRKKIVKYDGHILDIYPSVFTLNILNDKFTNKLSCSYSDFICGDIRFKRIVNNE